MWVGSVAWCSEDACSHAEDAAYVQEMCEPAAESAGGAAEIVDLPEFDRGENPPADVSAAEGVADPEGTCCGCESQSIAQEAEAPLADCCDPVAQDVSVIAMPAGETGTCCGCEETPVATEQLCEPPAEVPDNTDAETAEPNYED
jgi:hypothetical protein